MPGQSAVVELRAPLDVAASAYVLSAWGDDLLDRWDGEAMVRTAHGVPFAARSTGTLDAPALHVVPASLAPLAASVFDQREEALAAVAAVDPTVARLASAHPGLRPIRSLDPFTAVVRSISAQQVNLAFAARLRRRLAELVGGDATVAGRPLRRLDPAVVAELDVSDLRNLQFTTTKSRAIVELARAFTSGDLVPGTLEALPDEEVVAVLTRLHGIGRWTAEWYLVRVLGRAVVVAGDLVVRKAVGALYLDGRIPSEAETRRLTEHWGDAAAIVQQLALRHVTPVASPPAAQM